MTPSKQRPSNRTNGTPDMHHQQRFQSSNVIIFGDSGAGKSSFINLIAGEPLAETAASPSDFTFHANSHDVYLPDNQGRRHHFHLFETAGLSAPLGISQYLHTLARAHELICELSRTGGIRLLVFCIRGGRFKSTTQQNYSLFNDVLCHEQVPVALVITGLENEPRMECWMETNGPEIQRQGVVYAAHACITSSINPIYAKRYQESRQNVCEMLLRFASRESWNAAPLPWLEATAEMLLRWYQPVTLGTRNVWPAYRRYSQGQKELTRTLVQLGFTPNGAQYLAERLLQQHQYDVELPWTGDTRVPRVLHHQVPELPRPEVSHEFSMDPRPQHGTRFLTLGGRDLDVLDLSDQIIVKPSVPHGGGGYSDIWKCELKHNQILKTVAVKCLRECICGSAEADSTNRRLRRELIVWARLDHPNVLPLLGVTLGFGPLLGMVCPWAEKGDLTTYLTDARNHLTLAHRFNLLYDVASGLRYLHEQGVVHGDLTGTNILIDSDGTACVTDFGLSILLSEFSGTSYMTLARCSIRWADPELYMPLDSDNASEKSSSLSTEWHVHPSYQSDIYSFGCVMLQILSGKVPYHYYARQEQILLCLIRKERPRRPRSIIDEHWNFIQQCWTPHDVIECRRPYEDEIVDFVAAERNRLVYD